jgi:hypothetical protein
MDVIDIVEGNKAPHILIPRSFAPHTEGFIECKRLQSIEMDHGSIGDIERVSVDTYGCRFHHILRSAILSALSVEHPMRKRITKNFCARISVRPPGSVYRNLFFENKSHLG